jgi:hypothetical protein
MHFVTFNAVNIGTELLLEAFLMFVFFRKRLARIYPVFVLYLFINMVEDPLAYMLSAPGPRYARFYFVITILDYLLQFLVLVEVGRNVFRARKSEDISFPRLQVAMVAVLLLAAVGATLSPALQVSRIHAVSLIFFRLTLLLAFLKLLMFAFMAGFAQFLGIGWKNHVLQLATGLAFYGAVSVTVQIVVSHLSRVNQATFDADFNRLTQFQSVIYLATLGFWIWAFSRNEAPRKEFTPQMQQVLVTIAATARRTRLAVTRSGEQP